MSSNKNLFSIFQKIIKNKRNEKILPIFENEILKDDQIKNFFSDVNKLNLKIRSKYDFKSVKEISHINNENIKKYEDNLKNKNHNSIFKLKPKDDAYYLNEFQKRLKEYVYYKLIVLNWDTSKQISNIIKYWLPELVGSMAGLTEKERENLLIKTKEQIKK